MRKIARLIFALLCAAPRIQAQAVPATLNYQGRLTDNTPAQAPINAVVEMQFALYDSASGGTRLWQEPAADNTGAAVTVTAGIFNYVLGNAVAIPPTVFAGATSSRFLQITLDPAAGAEILSPRQLVTATGYANLAENSNNALSATTAATASNALNLGGVAASGYLLAGGTAFDSARLGGSLASTWQKALTTPACPAGQFYSALQPDGTAVCTDEQNSLTPPVAIAGNSDATILTVSNAGAGRAGEFAISNPASAANALFVTNNGTVSTLYASNTGSGNGGRFLTSNPNPGNGSAVYASASGSGYAGYFSSTSTTSNQTALVAVHTGSSAAALFRVQNSSSTAPALSVDTNGSGPAMIARAYNPAARPLVAQGALGQFASLQEWQDSSGMTLAWVSAAGVFTGTFSGNGSGLTNLPPLSLPYSGSTASAGSAFSVANSGTGPALTAAASNPAARPLVVQGAIGQTANLQEWRDSVGPLAAVTATGVFTGNGSGLTNLPPLSLPYSGSAATSGAGTTAFSVTNTGTGRAGFFSLTNGASGASALVATANGTGGAFLATNTGGSGRAGQFQISNSANTAYALDVFSNGYGALSAATSGTGSAGYFQSTTSATTNQPVLLARQYGIGTAAFFEAQNSASTAPALQVGNFGTGPTVFAYAENSAGIPMVTQGASGQTANLQEWRSSAGAPLVSVSATGQLKITGGAPGAGKVLTSDAAGLGSWSTLPAGNAGTVTSVTASAPLSVVNGTTTPALALSGIVPVANGGTGSATKNFVDLTTNQSVSGTKSFTGQVSVAGSLSIGVRYVGCPITTAYQDCACAAGETVISGGASAGLGWVGESRPVSTTTWRVGCFTAGGVLKNCDFMNIICARLAP